MNKEEIFYEMMESIYELSRYMSWYESIPRTYGTEDELYMVEAHTINLIGDKVQTNISELALLTSKTKGAISQMVDRLVAKEMVEKSKNPLDNREVIIKLTDRGHVVYNFHKELDEANYRSLLERLDRFETDDLLKYTSISTNLLKLMKEDNVK